MECACALYFNLGLVLGASSAGLGLILHVLGCPRWLTLGVGVLPMLLLLSAGMLGLVEDLLPLWIVSHVLGLH